MDKAITQSKAYLKHLITEYHLTLKNAEKQELLKVVKRFIQTKANNNNQSTLTTITSDKLREIKSELKKYCQSMYPEKFKKPKNPIILQNIAAPSPQRHPKEHSSNSIKSPLAMHREKQRSRARSRQRVHQPIGHYSNSRKELDRISIAKAESIVLIRLEKTVSNPAARELIHKEIMGKIKQKATPNGFVSRYFTNEVITKEIKIFKKLQKNLSES